MAPTVHEYKAYLHTLENDPSFLNLSALSSDADAIGSPTATATSLEPSLTKLQTLSIYYPNETFRRIVVDSTDRTTLSKIKAHLQAEFVHKIYLGHGMVAFADAESSSHCKPSNRTASQVLSKLVHGIPFGCRGTVIVMPDYLLEDSLHF